MTKINKIIIRILTGSSDKNIDFKELIRVLQYFDFNERQKGSHLIFFKEGIDEIINIQEGKNGKAKPYQVKKVRTLIQKYKLYLSNDE